MPSTLIPDAFASLISGRAPEPWISGGDWLAGLPRLIDDLIGEWRLTITDEPRFGECALVLPVATTERDAVLKLTWPHAEAQFEHLALRAWDGRGAVRLLRADPAHFALLLERLGDDDLTSVSVLEGCETIGSLLRELDHPPLPQLPPFSATTERWLRLLDAGDEGVPRRFTEQAASLLRGLASDATPPRLVHQDLHFENVLRATRAPWLAIDPKPINGPLEFGVAPAIWNRPDVTAAAHNARAHLLLRLGIMCDAAGLDEDKAAALTFVRVVINAIWGADNASWVTRMVTIAKAMTPD